MQQPKAQACESEHPGRRAHQASTSIVTAPMLTQQSTKDAACEQARYPDANRPHYPTIVSPLIFADRISISATILPSTTADPQSSAELLHTVHAAGYCARAEQRTRLSWRHVVLHARKGQLRFNGS